MLGQFVTANVGSLMLNVNGQDQPMMLKFLQIPQFVKKTLSGKINETFLKLLPGYGALPNYTIGDPVYLLTPYGIKEYETCVENEQIVFNNLLRSARNQIEYAFGDSKKDGEYKQKL